MKAWVEIEQSTDTRFFIYKKLVYKKLVLEAPKS